MLSAIIVAGAVVWAGLQVAGTLRRPVDSQPHAAALLALFAPAIAEAAADPRALLSWQPVAVAARTLFPKEFTALDAAFGAPFPFGPEQLERAHARWTADWLAWERRHDAECKLKVATIEHELRGDVGSPFGRAQLDAVEREKLDLYQQHYEEYSRVAKGLQALIRR
jgi:hypothetical protein